MVVAICFDGEFTGPCTKLHALVALGAACVDLQTGELLEKFMTHVRIPEGRVWDVETVEEFWKKDGAPFYAEILREQPTAPCSSGAGILFCQWFDQCVAKYKERGRICLLSDTAGVDFSWLETILPQPRAAKTLTGKYTPTINTAFFYLGLAQCLPQESLSNSENIVLKYLDVEKPDFGVAHDHDPSNDAAHMGLFFSFVCRELERRKLDAKRARLE